MGLLGKTKQYELFLDKNGNLQSLKAGGVEILLHGAGFIQDNQFVAMKTARQTGPNTIVAEADPKDWAKSLAGSRCPFRARITYQFHEDRIELTLEQSLEQYGGFAWTPSASILASHDGLADRAVRPDSAGVCLQTDPRWTTREGVVVRFNFGVWQQGFANAGWRTVHVAGKAVPCMANIVPGGAPITAVVYPLVRPTARDALTFDISAASADFLLPGGQPVHFDIKTVNAAAAPIAATVRFEVRDYLTQELIGSVKHRVAACRQGRGHAPTDVRRTGRAPAAER